MSYRSLLGIGFVFLFFIFFNSCRRADILVSHDEQKSLVNNNFFDLPAGAPSALKRIVEKIHSDNNQYGFISKLEHEEGMPAWDKVKIMLHETASASKNHQNKQSTDTIVIVPLVKEKQKVNTILVCKVSAKKVKIKMVKSKQYKQYGYSTGLNSLSAEFIAINFMAINYSLYADSIYSIKDKKLFEKLHDHQKNPPFKIRPVNNQVNNKLSNYYPFTYTQCYQVGDDGDNGQLLGLEPGENNNYSSWETVCYNVTIWIKVVDGTSTEGTGSGGSTGGGGGGTGGGTGDTDWWVDPCNQISGGRLENIIPCDGGVGWESFSISSLYPELDVSINDLDAVLNFKAQYYQLEQIYKSKSVDQYTYMSRDEFLNMLKTNPSLAASIDPVTILVKIGINAAADVLTQVVFIKLTDNSVTTWTQAFSKVDWWQVAATAATSFIPLRTTEGKFLIAAINGATACISDLTQNGFQSWAITGKRFVEGFCGSLLGSSLSDVASKFGSINNFGRALVTKLDDYFPYRTVTKWLGGGLQYINKSYNHTIIENGIQRNITLTALRKMNGWSQGKVAVIGRSMDKRVIPYAKYLSAELGMEVITIKNWSKWNPNLTIEQNKLWVKDLKEQGYTIYDIGIDPDFPADYGPFYGMEILEFFGW